MNIIEIIDEGFELEEEMDLIKEKIKRNRRELEKIEDMFNEVKLVQLQEYLLNLRCEEYYSN
ncbi:hypothetical protein SAMN04487886_12781 [Clostridium sp. DSM 8431]|uniref:hypothetical protein n=1 Tax=Clostridium sp. DSM 8431 TaxID=1761781 RepID=UPI0008EAD5EE|nr:hypothetical protein [Clostridium sp. DSM 8431]SFU89024.1 hypothetical protein SAMN04487886_12781 [Clostridium sp. DSM 8431]